MDPSGLQGPEAQSDVLPDSFPDMCVPTVSVLLFESGLASSVGQRARLSTDEFTSSILGKGTDLLSQTPFKELGRDWEWSWSIQPVAQPWGHAH